MRKKEKPKYKDIEFDSGEEIDFYKWCEIAKELNLVDDFIYQPEGFVLSEKKTYKTIKTLKTKSKEIEKHLLHPHEYTPDFRLTISKNIFPLYSNCLEFFVDVKGSFQQNDGARSFSINQKWVYDKYGVYINKVIPEKFFNLTFVPDNVKIGKSGKLLKRYSQCPTITQFLNNMENGTP
jgi:hypothetical protein